MNYQMTSGDWIVDVTLDVCEDVDKLHFHAKNIVTGEEKHVPHSPYQHMTQEALDAHVKNGFASKMSGNTVTNWSNETLLKRNGEAR